MNSTAAKIVIGAVIIIGIGGFIYWSSSQGSSATPVTANPTSAGSGTTDPNSSAMATTTSAGTTGSTAASGTYTDGTYTGAVANSVYGNVQVSATVVGGKLTDVTFIQAPSGEDHTNQVTAMSEPVLKSEAIASQSANVDIVSGATQTSEAFQQSLQSALSQAQA
jgi:uncharacterized protein with FMN-binding domain